MPGAQDSSLARAAAHLDAAFFLAMDHASDDDLTSCGLVPGDPGQPADQPPLSPWANTAHTIALAAMSVAAHLSEPIRPVHHDHCSAALLAAADVLAQVRPDVDAPLGDLLLLLELLASALRQADAHDHSQPHPQPQPPSAA